MEWLQKEEVRELEWEMSIEPLYKELWDPYSDLCEQTLIIQQAYPDKDDYHVEMKRTIGTGTVITSSMSCQRCMTVLMAQGLP